MKKTVTLLIIIFLSFSAKADCYTGYYIKFTIETINGEIRIGYVSAASCSIDADSLENAEYAKIKLIQWSQSWSWSQNQKESDFWYFQDRLEYEYKIWEEYEEKRTIYQLLPKFLNSAFHFILTQFLLIR